MPYVKTTAGGYEGPEVPDGLYILECTNIVAFTPEVPDNFGKLTPKLRIEMTGATPDGEAFTLDPLMNQTFSAIPGKKPSTLFTYADAFGCNPDPAADGFDTDRLLHRKLQAFITTEEEPGAWPRIQSFSKIKGGIPTPAQKTPPAAPAEATVVRPGVLFPDGSLDYTTFWKEVRRLGMTNESVVAEFGGDVERITKGDPIEIAEWLLVKQEALA